MVIEGYGYYINPRLHYALLSYDDKTIYLIK